MKVIQLRRVLCDYKATAGVLIEKSWPFAVALENPWKFNEIGVSCIPSGDYMCQKIESSKFGWTYQIMDVPRRTEIIFHWGNTSKDTKGCILLGSSFGILDFEPAVLSSKSAFIDFMGRLEGVEEFNFVVRPF